MEAISKSMEYLRNVGDKISFRKYSGESDYPIIKKWWLKHNAAFLDRNLLPGIGVVATLNNEPIGAAWLYLTNSLVAQIAWMVTKPELGPKTRLMAMFIIMSELEKEALRNGYTLLQIVSNRNGFSKIAMHLGFRMMKSHDFLFKNTIEDDDV